MAGGNMRVFAQTPGTAGLAKNNNTRVFDADALKRGSFTEARSVNGHQVFMTAGGAAAFDQLLGDGYQLSTAQDPGTLSRFFLGDPAANTVSRGEEFIGKVK